MIPNALLTLRLGLHVGKTPAQPLLLEVGLPLSTFLGLPNHECPLTGGLRNET